MMKQPKKQVHTYIDYDIWLLATTKNLKWVDVVKIGIRVLAGKASTELEMEQKIVEAKEVMKQKEREIEHWKETIVEFKEKEEEKARIERKKIIMEF